MQKKYIYLWSLLAVAFAAMFAFSLMADDLDLGAFSLRRSKMADALALAPAAQATTADPEPIAAPEPVSKTPVQQAPLDSCTVLFVGDSMVEGLYPRLAAYCEASGHTLYAVIWYSSTTERWGKNQLLKKYVDQIHPDYIFISLGGNELFVSNIAEKRDKWVKAFLAQTAGIPYVWIGPPNWKPDTGINDMIAANVPADRFFVTNGMKFERQQDGAHPTHEAAITWMDSVARWIPLHCNTPIVLNTPQHTKAKAKKVYVHKPGEKP